MNPPGSNPAPSNFSLANLSAEQQKELSRIQLLERAATDLPTFCREFVHILASSKESGQWSPFHLWPAQEEAAYLIATEKKLCILKARQLGLTWLVLAYALQQMVFRPIATVLLFSKTDDDAMELLEYRLTGMWERLPGWLKQGRAVTASSHELELPNGSRALSFATTGGRSYTATLAVIDEADFVPDLQKMLNSVQPTVDAGGKLVLLSSADKSQPESVFKRLYRAGKAKQSSYRPVFLGWASRPDRSADWYAAKRQDILAGTGGLDDLHQEYPEQDVEALAPKSEDKRLPAAWLHQCYAECLPLTPAGAPAVPDLVVWEEPVPGRLYVIGADPAEGNPTSDDSAACVLDAETGEQVAELAGKHEMDAFANYLAQLAGWYCGAGIMVERNNHGHTVLSWLRNHARWVRLLVGHDASGKFGWLTSPLGKAILYDRAAASLKNEEVLLHSFACFVQLSSIEGNTLSAPAGQHDDLATAFALAVVGRAEVLRRGFGSGWKSPVQLQAEAVARKRDGIRPTPDELKRLARRFGLAVD